jgi:uncharacterized protein
VATITTGKKRLSKLVIQVAHTCNLACPYCSSDKGRWGTGRTAVMPPQRACDAVREFAKNFDGINIIYFFGGEPTINLDAIEAVVRCVDTMVDTGMLPTRPVMGFTSNGYRITERLIDLLRTNGLGVGVSLDGPPDVNDKLRPTGTGAPTTERVIENIRTLRAKTRQPRVIEVTYTSLHLTLNWPLYDTLKFIQAATGVNRFAVTPAFDVGYTPNMFDPLHDEYGRKALLREMTQCVRMSMREIATLSDPLVLEEFVYWTKDLFQPRVPDLCPATGTYFAVANDGQIYPCQNLPERSDTALGNIYEIPHMLETLNHKEVVKEIGNANSAARKELSGKWFASGCKVCPAYNLSETGTIASPARMRYDLHASMKRAFAEELIKITRNDGELSRYEENLGLILH